MSTAELGEEIEATIAAHDLPEGVAARVRELAAEGEPVLDAIRKASEENGAAPPPRRTKRDPAEGLEQPTETMLRDLNRENERHAKKVRELMGGFVDGFGDCHTCDGLGLEPPAPRAKPHPFFQACETCNGYGKVLTGSLDEQNAARDCPDCGGRGYLEAMLDNTPAVELVAQWRAAQRAAQTPPPPPVVTAPAGGGGGDLEFGRPAWMGDPNVT